MTDDEKKEVEKLIKDAVDAFHITIRKEINVVKQAAVDAMAEAKKAQQEIETLKKQMTFQ